MSTASEWRAILSAFTPQGTQLSLPLRSSGYVEILDLSRKYR